VPAGAVEHERDVFATHDRLGEIVEERLHAGAVGFRQDQREGVVGAGLDCGINVGIHIALIDEARWPLAALPPDVTDAPLLADAGLVLKEQAQTLAFMRALDRLQDALGFF